MQLVFGPCPGTQLVSCKPEMSMMAVICVMKRADKQSTKGAAAFAERHFSTVFAALIFSVVAAMICTTGYKVYSERRLLASDLSEVFAQAGIPPRPVAFVGLSMTDLSAPAELIRPLPAAATAAAGASREKIKATAEAFEASFLSQMLKPMFEGLSTDGLFGGGQGEATWRPQMPPTSARPT